MCQDCTRKCAIILPVLSIILHVPYLWETGVPGVNSYKDYEGWHLLWTWMGFICEIVTVIATCAVWREKDTNRKEDRTTCWEKVIAFIAVPTAILWIFDLITILRLSQDIKDITLIEVIAVIESSLDISLIILFFKIFNLCCCCDDGEIPFRRLNEVQFIV